MKQDPNSAGMGPTSGGRQVRTCCKPTLQIASVDAPLMLYGWSTVSPFSSPPRSHPSGRGAFPSPQENAEDQRCTCTCIDQKENRTCYVRVLGWPMVGDACSTRCSDWRGSFPDRSVPPWGWLVPAHGGEENVCLGYVIEGGGPLGAAVSDADIHECFCTVG